MSMLAIFISFLIAILILSTWVDPALVEQPPSSTHLFIRGDNSTYTK